MSPVMQSAGPMGDCFRACVASIADARLEDTPDFVADWGSGTLASWLGERGLSHRMAPGAGLLRDGSGPRGWAVASVEFPFPGRYHAVVCLDGRLAHDPAQIKNPGLEDARVRYWTVIEKGAKRWDA